MLKFFDVVPGSGIRDGKSRIRDGKKSDPGSGINIPDPQPCPKHWSIYMITPDGMTICYESTSGPGWLLCNAWRTRRRPCWRASWGRWPPCSGPAACPPPPPPSSSSTACARPSSIGRITATPSRDSWAGIWTAFPRGWRSCVPYGRPASRLYDRFLSIQSGMVPVSLPFHPIRYGTRITSFQHYQVRYPNHFRSTLSGTVPGSLPFHTIRYGTVTGSLPFHTIRYGNPKLHFHCWFFQFCGSGSVGSTCFCDSRIRKH